MAPSPDPADLLLEVDERLSLALPVPHCELDHDDPWQLLVVTILSAQAKDAVINEIRPELFERWPTPASLAAAPHNAVELVIKRSGFFRRKAKAIQACAQALLDHHGGVVPRTQAELVALPGASHKTANLVLGIAFGVASGIVVDTHVARVAARLGLSSATAKAAAVERTLCELIPRDRWIGISHRLILHGRHVCKGRAPNCGACALASLCPAREPRPGAELGDWEERARFEARLFAARGELGDDA